MKTLKLTAILVEDPNIGGFTAFFAQLPNIIAEGKTEDIAVQNLIQLMKEVFSHESSKEQETYPEGFKTRNIEFADTV